jgi:hypothetical protein
MDSPHPETRTLPPPQISGGKPLMEALKLRHSSRSFAAKPLPVQLLSNLLWAACGVNRADSGGLTAPSARNWQEIAVYAAMSDGLFRYDAKQHRLIPVLARDLRGLTGQQDFVAPAPLNLVYVADLSGIDSAGDDERRFYTAADAAFMAQNVYLFCASEGLATVVRGLVDRKAFAQAAQLGAQQRVILAQTVGYPTAS